MYKAKCSNRSGKRGRWSDGKIATFQCNKPRSVSKEYAPFTRHLNLSFNCSQLHPYPYTTKLQQTTLKTHLGNTMENFEKWKHFPWIKLKTVLQKEKLIIMCDLSFCHSFQKSSAANSSECVYKLKRVENGLNSL